MYDRAFFDRPIDRRGTACEKWDVAMARDARVSNPMWVADMDFRCPDEVVNALCERAAHPVYGYTEQTDRAVAAMLDFMERRPCALTAAKQRSVRSGTTTRAATPWTCKVWRMPAARARA